MTDQIDKTGQETFKGASGGLSLLARMFAVAAIGVVVVEQINHVAPWFVWGGPGDATAFVIEQMKAMARLSLKLMAVGRDVLAFFAVS